jgi:sterol 3beta-glucosyltransferase
MMKIAIVCNDTRGGVQPYLALGLGLKRAGHSVAAVAPSEFNAMFAQNGIPMTPLSGGDEVAQMRAVGNGGKRNNCHNAFHARAAAAPNC